MSLMPQKVWREIAISRFEENRIKSWKCQVPASEAKYQKILRNVFGDIAGV